MLKKFVSRPPVSFLLEVMDSYARVGVARSAAALSYFLILTLFPLLLCMNYFIGLFHLDFTAMLQTLEQFLPHVALTVMEEYVNYVGSAQGTGLLWAALFTILLSASAGLRTLFHTMDDLYQVESRSMLGRYLPSIVLSFLLVPTIFLSIVVIFTGGWFFGMLETHLPQRLAEMLPIDLIGNIWVWLRYLLLFCLVFLLVLVVYRVGTPGWVATLKMLLAPALLTALAMVACSGLFSWFIDMSTRYALVYGSLASIIILLVWLYFCGNILLLGAVVSRAWVRRWVNRIHNET